MKRAAPKGGVRSGARGNRAKRVPAAVPPLSEAGVKAAIESLTLSHTHTGRGIRKGLRDIRQAVNGGWPITPEVRMAVLQVCTELLGNAKSRVKVQAARTIAVLNGQNQADTHLRVRMENTGIKLVEARQSLTREDGTVETREIKLWGVGSPVDEV